MASEQDLEQPTVEHHKTQEIDSIMENGGKNGVEVTKSKTIKICQNLEQNSEENILTNGENDNTDENLIELDSPGSDTFNAFLSCRLIERATALRNAADEASCSTSGVQNCSDNRLSDQSMHSSRAESGYLTESVASTSTLGCDRLESVSSEGDRTPCDSRTVQNDLFSSRDGVAGCSSCGAEGFSGSCDKPRTDSTSSAKAFDLINALDNLKDLDLGTDVRFKSNATPVKLIDLDEIFVKCDSSSGQSRPESLSLPKPPRSTERPHSKSDASSAIPEQVEETRERKRSKSSGFPIPRLKEGVDITDDGLSKSLPHGIVTRKGDMIEFVADDLQEMIKRSSPMSKTASSVSSRRSSLISISSNGSSAMATSMTSGSAYPQSPDLIPPIDPIAIVEIENQARLVADSLDLMMGNLRSNLHNMSAISVGCEEAYKTSVDVTCETVDSSIKSMYALMAKCEELSASMQPVYKLADQIKEIKRLLDRLESQITE